jgi:hypothetical protein
MKCYSYIVARDFGFAPNPFGGYCTLATCKPGIREGAQIRDWVLGTGSSKMGLNGKLIFLMHVYEKLGFNDYWHDNRFQYKKPVLNGSLKQMYGDNIYYFDKITNVWLQTDSHHSNQDGSPNKYNMNKDLKSHHVLVSKEFYYFGKSAKLIPRSFRNNNDFNICMPRQGYRYNFPEDFVDDFLQWVKGSLEKGYHGNPNQFDKFERYDGVS